MDQDTPASGPDHMVEEERAEEIEFFSIYAKNYAEPEVAWLSRAIGNVAMASADTIARRVLAAGYQRAPIAIPTCGCRSQAEHDDHLQDEGSL